MKTSKLLVAVVAVASTLFVALSARAEFTCELSFPQAPSTALANFPVLVRLAEGAPTGFSYVDCPTGGCIWFTDASDNAIPCDVDTWDIAGESLVWVSVPSLSSAATITMHWDASGAPAGLPAASQVWALADYVGVWHMNEILEDTSSNKHYTPDSSASGWHAYKANEADAYPQKTSVATAWVSATADSAPPTGRAMTIRNDNTTGKSRTVGGFLVPSSATCETTIGPFTISLFEACYSSGNDRVIGFGEDHKDLPCMTASPTETYVMNGRNNREIYKQFTYGDGLSGNSWRHIAGVYDSTPSAYVGGASRALGVNGWTVATTLAKGVGLGTFTGHTETFGGDLDEIRIRNAASTAEWIAEEYKTVTTAKYVSFGTVDMGVEVLRLGAVAVSDVTPTNAVVSGELRTLGEGATSADVYLVYTDGATTNAVSLGTKSAEPSAFSVTLENLTEKTTYTCWFTATNSLSAGSNSPTATFKTKRIVSWAGFFCELSFPTAAATALANFPVLVRLSADAPEGFFYDNCPTGANLWFTDENDAVLPFEVDTWDTAGESLVWVSVPSLSSTATITMHWSANEGDVEDSPSPSQVWTRAGYNAVWHFSGSAAESAKGLVANVTKGTPTYDGNASYPGPLGKTLWLSNSSALGYYVDSAWTTLGADASMTVSCWARPVGISSYARMVCCQTSWDVAHGYTFAVHNPTSKITLGSSGSSELSLESNQWSGWPATDWVHFTATYTNTAGAIFKDGLLARNGEIKSLVTPQGTLFLGANGDGTQRFWVGGLDEIRIRAAASSAEWIAAEYATMTAANYVAFGEVEQSAGSVKPLEFGEINVSSVTATGATLSARFKGLGENATSANLWLVVSGFGQTRTYPLDPATESKVVVTALTGLQPGAEWTAYLTATNNASPAVGADSAPVAFVTLSDAGSGSPGLYQASTTDKTLPTDAAANWDIAASGVVMLGPLAMRSAGNTHDIWMAVNGVPFTWSSNTGFGYAGYMYMEGGKDYWFGASADDEGYVWVDNGDANWNAKRTGSQFGGHNNWKAAGPYAIAESGYYRVVFACWNGNGGAGAEPTASVLFPKMRYIALESGASAPTAGDAGWQEAVDPGDGSLFVTEAPTRAVSVLSAVRDGTLLSAKVALGETFTGESSVLRYVYGATNGGSDPADWEGGALVASSLLTTAATNDYLVGIASDTRFVRFYTQDGDAITWSATVSLDWAGETTIAGGFLFLGDPDASAVSGDTVTLSAVLNAPGEDATNAQAWFVVSGGGVTRTIPAGTATAMTNLFVAVTGLAPETTYTFYATATNNAATSVGVDSAVATFTTGAGASAWNTSRATFTPDGKSLTATIPVTSLGVGTTTLYLMTGGNANSENTVSDSVVVTEPGTYSLTGDFSDSPWGTRVYYSLKLVNGTSESAITNWPIANNQEPFHNKSIELQDNSTYTWVGGSVGVWNDTANWELTAAGSLAQMHPAGYPVFGSTAIFATAQGDDPITVTIPAAQGTTKQGNNPLCWWVSNLNLDGMHEELVFTSEDIAAATSRFFAYNALGSQTYNRLTFDGCNVWMYTTGDLGASAADANGENFVLRFTGGTTAAFNQINVKSKPGFKFLVEDGATVPTCTGGIYGGSTSGANPCVLEIDNTAVTTSNKVEPDNANSKNGMVFRISGTNATLVAQYFQPKFATSTNVIEFVVPVGGYNAVPVQTTHNTYVLGSDTTKAPMTLRVAKDSPGLKSIGSRGIQLLYSKGGINAANVRFEDVKASKNGFFFKDADGNEYADAAAIEAAGKTSADITQIWYRSPARPLTIVVR